MKSFYSDLVQFAQALAEELTYAGDDQNPHLEVEVPIPLPLNYPWVYLNFEIDGTLAFADLSLIKSRISGFLLMNGGSLEEIRVVGRAAGRLRVHVKLVYVASEAES